MAQPFRLAEGGRIDRAKPIASASTASPCEAYAGDTVASALLANGIHLVGRSFKYHRPRGIFSHGAEEPNALFSVDRGGGRIDPNNRATSVEAVDGLGDRARRTTGRRSASTSARSTTCWRRCSSPASTTRPSCGRGRSGTSSTSRGSAPPRVLAGRPPRPIPDRYQHTHAHCDVLIVGAGPAGLAAALAASQGGKRVILADEQAEMGGALLHEATATIDGKSAWAWLADTLATLGARDERHLAAAHHRLRLLQSQPHRPGAAPDRPPAASAPGLAARAAVAGPRRRGRAGDRRARAPAGLRRQRPARHHAGREPARLCQPLRRGARAARRHRDVRRSAYAVGSAT